VARRHCTPVGSSFTEELPIKIAELVDVRMELHDLPSEAKSRKMKPVDIPPLKTPDG
jgi:hypothetical protein